jgi:SAM-dependent methyltransferase
VISWHEDSQTFMVAANRIKSRLVAIESHLESLESIPGYCAVCEKLVQFRVSAGVFLGPHVSLRAGMVCRQCNLSSRSRLLFDAISETLGDKADATGAILEALSPFAARLTKQYPSLTTSEYLGDDMPPGGSRMLNGTRVRHESLLQLSYKDASLDLVSHNDVLEHVYDTDRALRESRRVLRSGGACVFLMPFFPFRPHSLLRGRLRDDGSIEHIEEPEYHGDGVTGKGIYTYHYFGLDFVDRLREAGFRKVQIGLTYDVFLGYLGNNYRYGDDGIVLPTVFRAYAP